MPKRPSLSDVSFLGHLFSPAKHPQPSGIRKTTLTGTRGRNKGRLAAFNRMKPVSQELLKRAGMRDQYLKGEVSLADAKKAMRPAGIRAGVAKPVKGSGPTIRTSLDARVAAHLKYTIRQADRPLNPHSVDRNVLIMPGDVMPDVVSWDYAQIKHAGRKGSEFETIIDGYTRNPFWYK